MDWREAFLKQARSDFQMMEQLAKSGAEACHRLHYLQMATEKLARGWGASPGSPEPPPMTHIALVRLLQQIKGMPWVCRKLGYDDHRVFSSFVKSLFGVAGKVQGLVPSEAGYDQPNPEYPWRNRGTNTVYSPCDFEFEEFNPRDVRLKRLVQLVRDLLRIAE
jgi:hypothetical protein